MCRIRFILLSSIAVILLEYNAVAQISKVQAIDIVMNDVVSQDTLYINVYCFPNMSSENSFALSPYDSILNPYDTAWIFFIDLMPEYGWAHPCKYVFIRKSTGNYIIMDGSMPPLFYWLDWEVVSVPFPHQNFIQSIDTTFDVYTDIIPDPHKYALLITWNAWEDQARWNNLSHIFSGLKQTYGFLDENIFVLSDDGLFPDSLNLDLDNLYPLNDFDGPCTKEKIAEIFEYLDSAMTDEDIFLFYATTHGDTLVGDPLDTTSLRLWNYQKLFDYELEEMVNNLECSQMILCIDACHAGGFMEELEGEHRVVQVPVPRGKFTTRMWDYFDYFTYGWATAMRGWHVKDVTTPWEPSSYRAGYHPHLDSINPEWTNKIDFDPDSLCHGGNQDGFIQFEEIFYYTQNFDGQAFLYNLDYENHGFIGDLLTLNGIEGRVDTTQYVSGPYLIGRKLTIAPNVTLSNSNYTYFYLNDSSEINVSESACFNPYGYWTNIVGCSGESYIKVKGSLRSSVMDFSANTGATLNICFENTDNDYTCSYFDFSNCRVTGKSRSLSFDESSFTNSMIDFNTGNLILSDRNEFVNSTIICTHPGSDSSYCNIIGNSFVNDVSVTNQAVITVEEYSNFLIEDNEISYDENRGIELFYAGWDATSDHSVNENTIQFTGDLSDSVAELGIHAYYSDVNIYKNKIQFNDYGITGFHRSEMTVLGNENANEIDDTQIIGDNDKSQCLFNISTFPTEFHWNVIQDNTSEDKPYIKVVEFDEMIEDTSQVKDWIGDPVFDVTYNCWVNDTNPENRLVPVGAYVWDPTWCPGSGHLLLQNEPELMYYQAISDIENENYTQAETDFKQLIAEYPEDKYAQASLKGLFALNPAIHDTDFTSLKTYCDSLSLNPGDSLLGTTANWLSIHCDIKDQQYQQAINSLDSVISNPGTLADSVFAMIDLNYVYLKTLDSNNLKSSCFIKNENILGRTAESFQLKRRDWIELLMKDTETNQGVDGNSPGETMDYKSVHFTSIHPNPASDYLNISYKVSEIGRIGFSLYSITGQQMINLDLGTPSPGEYSQSISLAAIPQGIYVLNLFVNGAAIYRIKVIKAQ